MKHRILCICLALFVAASPVNADETNFDDLFLVGDFAAIDDMLRDLHASHVAGEVEASTLRSEFAKFSGTAPQIETMVQDWLVALPDSPYAHSAATWFYHGRAWRKRGGDIYGYTWHAAIEGFQDNLSLSQSHAWTAFDISPDLVPASDALLMNEMVFDQLGPFGVLQLTKAVMATTPNRGTLYRASSAFRPNWGGDISRVGTLCNENAPLITNVDNYTAEACVADMILWNNVGGRPGQHATQVLKDHGWVGFENHRFTDYARPMGGENSGLTHEDVANYLMQDDTFDYALAQAFYNVQFYNYPPPDVEQKIEATQIILRNKVHAQNALLSDPGNRDLIEMVLFRTETVVEIVARPDRDAAIEMWGNVLAAAPYDPDVWLETGIAMSQLTDARYRAGGMPAFGNAIAYSNHKPDRIGYVLGSIMRSHVQDSRRETSFDFDTYDADITCPALRLHRLFEAACDAAPNAFRCNQRANLEEQMMAIVDDAETRNVCTQERASPLQDIAFYPTAVQVGDYAHPADR